MKVDNGSSLANETSIDIKYYIGGSEAIPIDQREKNSIKARHLGAEMLGLFLLILIILFIKKMYLSKIIFRSIILLYY